MVAFIQSTVSLPDDLFASMGGQLLLEALGHLGGLQLHHLGGDLGLDALGNLCHQHVLKGCLLYTSRCV